MDGLVSPDGFIVNSARARRIGQQASTNPINFPLVDFPQYYTQIEICDYSRGGVSTADLLNLMKLSDVLQVDGRIHLPLPFSIVDAENVAYEEVSLGTLTGTAISSITSDASLENIAAELTATGSMTALGAIRDLVGAAGGTAGGAAGTILQNTATNAVNLIRAINGVALNPYNVVLLQGPRYKNHMLTWKMSPNNDKEMKQILKIIEALKKAQRPELSKVGGLFKFPKVLRIKMMTSDGPNGSLMMFKPCVIETASVNYTPGNTPSLHRDGTPTVYEIRLALKELEYWFSDDEVFDSSAKNIS